ncbi:hypothetical protein [[Clostridium] hylemonae]|uniref:Uncharacterized protein n=1 Tax=[Clostridium] hylemonae DSM 15053 TaxID=553973 RepID=C0C605_9FIRM|nr:hypothetical protein [[Clostridium] hylemonae]EEG72539.1 hypothetical protein CLOHYLEM_07542 [[Clostridium] hylemonae DSM 15053]
MKNVRKILIYIIEKLGGTLCSRRQIELSIFPEIYNYIIHYNDELKSLSKDRFYRAQRIKYFKECKKREHANLS